MGWFEYMPVGRRFAMADPNQLEEVEVLEVQVIWVRSAI
jgi:hypothetical protein